MESEVPKHKKKSRKKKDKRADHKHTYVECLITDGVDTSRAVVCTICLKIYNRFLFEELESSKFKNSGAFGCLPYEGMLKKYPKYKVYKVSDKTHSKECICEIER